MKYTSSDQDELLLELIKKGDQQAFSSIYDRFAVLLYVYACRICKDEVIAEDIIQEIFVSLWDKRRDIQLKSSLSAYLYTAVRYKFFDLVAKNKVRSDYVDEFKKFVEIGYYCTDDYINEKELIALVEAEVSKLPSKMQEVFILSRNEGLSHKEISTLLLISEKTVKNQLTNALKILRVKLDKNTFLFLLFF